MSVQITFEPDGGNGLVAEGTSIWEAAKRLGVNLRAECRGRGECDSCAVAIDRGAELLSSVTSAEEKILGPNRLECPTKSERLGCQAVLEKQGEVMVRLAPIPEDEQHQNESQTTLRGLPLKEKVSAFIELEAVAITGAVNSLRGSYHALIEKVLNLKPQTTNDESQTTKDGESTTKERPDQSEKKD